MLLVDSSIYIDLLRAKKDPVAVLRPWIVREEILCCGVIRCEVLRGVVKKKVLERMRELFDTLSSVEINESEWDETCRLAWTLDRRGVVLPLSDLVIGVCALRAKASVISSDAHFRMIPNLSVYDSLPAL